MEARTLAMAYLSRLIADEKKGKRNFIPHTIERWRYLPQVKAVPNKCLSQVVPQLKPQIPYYPISHNFLFWKVYWGQRDMRQKKGGVRMVVLTANFLLFPFVLLVEHLFSPQGVSSVPFCRSTMGATL